MRVFGGWRPVKGLLVVAILAGCDTTEPDPEINGAVAHIVIPPIQNYSFSAVIDPGCQDTGYGISNAGTIIGQSSCTGMGAFLKTSTGTIVILPPLASQGAGASAFPLDLNAGGRIIGYSVRSGTSNLRAVQWLSVSGVMTASDLGVLPGGSSSKAFGVNANNDVVGWSEIAMAGGVIRKHATLWRQGSRIDLSNANCYHNSEAYDVNDQGFVVGVSYTPIAVSACSGVPTRQATLWKPAGTGSNVYSPVALPTLNASEARAINNPGDIAGYHRSTAAGGNTILAKWKVNTVDFTTISPGDSYTVPEDINDAGLIVGEREVNGVRVAFAYGTRFATMPVPVTSSRSFAMGVNSCGNVAGEGHQNQGGPTSNQVAAKWTKNGC